ncbi:MAG: orotidine-5'-phosphate decarboxylase [Micrococcales bacterium]|nr:orotidine-5'-phosphate decarboxylase [Micrococcales bacterium]
MSFGSQVMAAIDRFGHLCVGLDPSAAALAAWQLEDTPDSVETFCEALLEAADGVCGLVKPQSAFFERHGAAGVSVLERVLRQAHQRGLVTILDVKRGDIGSTMGGYAEAFLADAAPLAASAITLSPYLGFGALRPAIDLALANNRGVFCLALTSNPEGVQVQGACGPDGVNVAESVLRQAGKWNQSQKGLGSVGVVVGATLGQLDRSTKDLLERLNGPILAPGIGPQGARPGQAHHLFGEAYAQVIAPASRAIAKAGPEMAALRSGIERLQAELAS